MKTEKIKLTGDALKASISNFDEMYERLLKTVAREEKRSATDQKIGYAYLGRNGNRTKMMDWMVGEGLATLDGAYIFLTDDGREALSTLIPPEDAEVKRIEAEIDQMKLERKLARAANEEKLAEVKKAKKAQDEITARENAAAKKAKLEAKLIAERQKAADKAKKLEEDLAKLKKSVEPKS